MNRPTFNQSLLELAKESKVGILDSLEYMVSLETENVIYALILLPLEKKRLQNRLKFAQDNYQSHFDFYVYHLQHITEAEKLTMPKKQALNSIVSKI